jgi:hypothetical protein
MRAERDDKESDIDDNFYNDVDSIHSKDGGTTEANYGDIDAPPLYADCRCYLCRGSSIPTRVF